MKIKYIISAINVGWVYTMAWESGWKQNSNSIAFCGWLFWVHSYKINSFSVIWVEKITFFLHQTYKFIINVGRMQFKLGFLFPGYQDPGIKLRLNLNSIKTLFSFKLFFFINLWCSPSENNRLHLIYLSIIVCFGYM